MRSILERIANLSKRQKIVLGSFLALIVIGSFSNSTDTETSSEVRNPVATSESEAVFPKIERGYDGMLEKILRDFYADYNSESWWKRIDKVVEGVIGDETAKMIYIKTDYRLDSVDDVEQATLLCNALISHLPREGLSVRIDGLIRNGRILLDGTVESKIQEAPVTTFGSSANTDGIPDWCVARTLFYNIVDGLKARGWKQQYGYGSLTSEEKKKMYQGAFMQEGPVYFK